MIWTFCPKCSARVEWAPTCTACGARIPAHDFASGQAAPQPSDGDTAGRAESRDYRWDSEFFNYVTAFVIFVGIMAAAVFLIRYAIAGDTDAEASGSSGTAGSANVTDNTPPEITAVSVSDITGTGATVNWVTDEASSSQVDYFDLASRETGSTGDSALATAHSVTIASLRPGMTYHFAAWSTDASGNRAASTEAAFNTPLPVAGGQIETGAVYFHDSRVLGTDKMPIELHNNPAAVDVSWEYLRQFLLDDGTDRMPYVEGAFDCSEFAETLHNSAEAAGIRTAYVCLGFAEARSGHAINAFQTTDAGLVFIDCTGQPLAHWCPLDSRVDIQMGLPYSPQLITPCSYIVGLTPLGTVTDISITW